MIFLTITATSVVPLCMSSLAAPVESRMAMATIRRMKYLCLALLVSTPVAAETFDATADGGFPCDSFSGSFNLEGTRFSGRLNSPSAGGFWFDTRIEKGVFDTAGGGTYGAVRIQGSINIATVTLFASEADCSGNLRLKSRSGSDCAYPSRKGGTGRSC